MGVLRWVTWSMMAFDQNHVEARVYRATLRAYALPVRPSGAAAWVGGVVASTVSTKPGSAASNRKARCAQAMFWSSASSRSSMA